MRKWRREVSVGASRISCVLSRNIQTIINQDAIVEQIKEFYTDLYTGSVREAIELADARDDLSSTTPSGVTM